MRVWMAVAACAAWLCGPAAARSEPDKARAKDVRAESKVTWPARLPLKGAQGQPGVLLDAPAGANRLLLAMQWTRKGVDPDVVSHLHRDAIAIEGRADAPTIEWEGLNAYTFNLTEFPADRPPRRKAGDAIAERFLTFISARDGGEGKVLAERTWFSYYPAKPDAEVRGLAVIMPGIFGEPRPVVERLAAGLQQRGWSVVRMMAQSSRFTESARFTVDPAAAEAGVGAIAAKLGDRVAECAFAVEAACRWAEKNDPRLAERQRLIIGMSGGAMTLPTIVARERERYGAAVMIAGGANWLTLTDMSVYKHLIRAIDFDWAGGDPDEATRERVGEVYLKMAPLDSYHTAPRLRGMRMLVIHGSADMAVPAASGEVLWTRLGKPARWTLTAGHEQLFFWVQRNLERVLAWTDGGEVELPPEVTVDGAGRAK